ncbi:unnamed protein product [Caenorhabditis nigoni]
MVLVGWFILSDGLFCRMVHPTKTIRQNIPSDKNHPTKIIRQNKPSDKNHPTITIRQKPSDKINHPTK